MKHKAQVVILALTVFIIVSSVHWYRQAQYETQLLQANEEAFRANRHLKDQAAVTRKMTNMDLASRVGSCLRLADTLRSFVPDLSGGDAKAMAAIADAEEQEAAVYLSTIEKLNAAYERDGMPPLTSEEWQYLTKLEERRK